MKIEILHTDDCPSYKEATRLIKEILKEEKIKAEIKMILIKTDEEAKKYKFPGSPTIRIDGKSIDPNDETVKVYSKRCKVFVTEYGVGGVPPKEFLKNAILKANKRT